jgi:putative phosphoribosyl transferase
MMARSQIFANRSAAGAQLARALAQRTLRPPVIVLGLPRGGVPVAFEIARALHAPLDVLIVRKIGLPEQPEFAVGAIASGDVLVQTEATSGFERLVQRERAELERRERLYRAGLPPLQLAQHTVVLVDDGLATGSTMLVALRAARKAGASTVICAAPVASAEAAALVAAEADGTVILQTEPLLSSIGEWYQDFEQLEDSQVLDLLAQARLRPRSLK